MQQLQTTNYKLPTTRGFTLVEMIVAVALFAIVMTVATGAIFTIVNANRSAQSLNSVITNLNFAIESMLRDIRTGINYDCTANPVDPTPHNCATSGNSAISFINSNADNIQYTLSSSGAIIKTVAAADSSGPITAPEVHIETLEFYVDGAESATPNQQPHVLVRIKGYAGGSKNISHFDIQTYVSQRVLNVN